MQCRLDVQPYTWVELAPGVEIPPGLASLLKESPFAGVTVMGHLETPPLPGPDDPAKPLLIALAQRAGNRRFGHLGGQRTQFVVEEFVAFGKTSVDPETLTCLDERAPDPPLVPVQIKTPWYPTLARNINLTGDVALAVEVEGGRVARVSVLSGDRLLAGDAEKMVRSWDFDERVTTTFTTLLSFRLERRPAAVPAAPTIELHLPGFVRVTAAEKCW